jgi:hypothetical protein
MKKLMITFTLTIQLRMLWFHWNISRWKGCQCLLAHEACECWRRRSLKPTYKRDSRWEWWLVIIKQCPKHWCARVLISWTYLKNWQKYLKQKLAKQQPLASCD